MRDREGYPNGAYIGLFPSGRVYVPGGTDSTYTTQDVFRIEYQGNMDVAAYKNDLQLHSWWVTSSPVGALLWFYEYGSSLQVLSIQAPTPAPRVAVASTHTLARKGPVSLRIPR